MKTVVAALVMLPISALAQTSPDSELAKVPPDSPLGTLLAQHITIPKAIPASACQHTSGISIPRSGVGITIVAFRIATDGSVKDVSLEQSSGMDALDQAVVQCAGERRYSPATKDGQAVEVSWKLRVDWKLGRPHL